MALPTSREETATPASPVSSNTINAIQDAIIGGKFASETLWQVVPAVGYWPVGGGGAPNVVQQDTYGGLVSTADVEEVWFANTIDLRPGDRITAIHLVARGTAAAPSNLTARLKLTYQSSATAMTISTTDPVDTGASTPAQEKIYSLTLGTPIVIGNGLPGSYPAAYRGSWQAYMGKTGDIAIAVGLTKDRL